jgi:presenilin-like A22 family membrane protease
VEAEVKADVEAEVKADVEADEEPPAAVEADATAGNRPDEPENDGQRDALFIGLGDAVIPTVLVASVAFFAPGSPGSLGIPYLAMTLPTLTAMLGTVAGLVVLLWMVLKGRAHAGLPLLNGGTLLGYLGGSVLAGVGVVEALGLSGLF